jgi:hypothetical protein
LPAQPRLGAPQSAAQTLLAGLELPGRGARLVIVDGRFAPGLSRIGDLPAGVWFGATEAAIGYSPRLLQAVIRFEVRLAETHAAAGLREARVARFDQLVYLHQDIIVSNGDIERNLVVQGDAAPS